MQKKVGCDMPDKINLGPLLKEARENAKLTIAEVVSKYNQDSVSTTLTESDLECYEKFLLDYSVAPLFKLSKIYKMDWLNFAEGKLVQEQFENTYLIPVRFVVSGMVEMKAVSMEKLKEKLGNLSIEAENYERSYLLDINIPNDNDRKVEVSFRFDQIEKIK